MVPGRRGISREARSLLGPTALLGFQPPMATFEELDALASKELHARAVRLATRRLDVRWLWDLFEAIPQAEVAAGQRDEAYEDQRHVLSLIEDAFRLDEEPLADALRPMYIEYLLAHETD